MLELFSSNNKVGVFRGFKEGGLEFHADLTLPYKSNFQSIPMIGQFLLIQLENEDEAVLGRIASLSSEGKLSSSSGEEYNIRAMEEGRPVPEDLREQYLKYRINIRVLGVVRLDRKNNQLTFVASHRRLPHVGSPVAFPSSEILKELAGSNIDGAEIGFFTLGEFVYSGESDRIEKSDWMQIKSPAIPIKFPINNLIARRSFIFARAGFGKSNLNKLLFSELYKENPSINDKNGISNRPVGTIIFDPDGEYFWPDNKKRPGLCDVPHLQDRLVVFTNRQAPSAYYESFVVNTVKLDIRKFSPIDVLSLALPTEKQDQQNVAKLKSLDKIRWSNLVDLIAKDTYNSNDDEIKNIMEISNIQDVEINAIKSNMTKIVNTLHDSSNLLFETLMQALKDGKLCVVDMSQMRGKSALILSSLIVRRIFNHNSEEFTKKDSKAIPTLLVMEEAQSILNDKDPAAEPFVEWVKEGRKYDLGALMVTQQPGSISTEILSQGDNWFIMHLLSEADLRMVKSSNSHFSNDILSVLLNEAIPGQGVFWTSVNGKPYPLSLRVLSFENLYAVQDLEYKKSSIENYASKLKNMLSSQENTIQDLKWSIIQSCEQDIQSITKDKGLLWGHLFGKVINMIPENFCGDKSKETNRYIEITLNHYFQKQWHVKTNANNKREIYIKSQDTN